MSRLERVVTETQLQFPFMRDVNLQLYMREQRTYLKIRYDMFMKDSSRLCNVTFSDYIEAAIHGGVAEAFQNSRRRKYFSEDDCIVDRY